MIFYLQSIIGFVSFQAKVEIAAKFEITDSIRSKRMISLFRRYYINVGISLMTIDFVCQEYFLGMMANNFNDHTFNTNYVISKPAFIFFIAFKVILFAGEIMLDTIAIVTTAYSAYTFFANFRTGQLSRIALDLLVLILTISLIVPRLFLQLGLIFQSSGSYQSQAPPTPLPNLFTYMEILIFQMANFLIYTLLLVIFYIFQL